ncbi:MAG: hypothetical protein ACPIOQ_21695 [Promethearchaeia archaeon]
MHHTRARRHSWHLIVLSDDDFAKDREHAIRRRATAGDNLGGPTERLVRGQADW